MRLLNVGSPRQRAPNVQLEFSNQIHISCGNDIIEQQCRI